MDNCWCHIIFLRWIYLSKDWPTENDCHRSSVILEELGRLGRPCFSAPRKITTITKWLEELRMGSIKACILSRYKCKHAYRWVIHIAFIYMLYLYNTGKTLNPLGSTSDIMK